MGLCCKEVLKSRKISRKIVARRQQKISLPTACVLLFSILPQGRFPCNSPQEPEAARPLAPVLNEMFVELQSMQRNSPHEMVRFKDRSSLIVCSHLLFRVVVALRNFRSSVIFACTFSKLATFSPNAKRSLSALRYDTGAFFDFSILCCCNKTFFTSERIDVRLFI